MKASKWYVGTQRAAYGHASHTHAHTRTPVAENEFNEIGFLHHFSLAVGRQTLARDSFYFRLSKFCVLRFCFSLHFHLELNRLKIRGQMGMAFIATVPSPEMFEICEWLVVRVIVVFCSSFIGNFRHLFSYLYLFRIRVLISLCS